MAQSGPSVGRGSRRRRMARPIGIAIAVLAAVGLIAVVAAAVNIIGALVSQRDTYERYENFILPVVMMDPVPFSDVRNIDENLLMQSSLWAALLGENRSSYQYDDTGLLLVPASDVDVAAASLFGPQVTVVHRTFSDYDASYLYDASISCYRVPLIAKVAYSPKVESMEKNGDVITLKVGYIAPGNVWSTNVGSGDSEDPTPDKYMYYDLTKWEGGYYISAIRDIDENAPAVS